MTETTPKITLLKQMCMDCHANHGKPWATLDEWRWEELGFVRCPVKSIEGVSHFIKRGIPPSNCLMMLEQVVLNQKDIPK